MKCGFLRVTDANMFCGLAKCFSLSKYFIHYNLIEETECLYFNCDIKTKVYHEVYREQTVIVSGHKNDLNKLIRLSP